MAVKQDLNTGESHGIVYAIRFTTTGEEKVARQIARLDQALNLLRGGRSSRGAFYNSSVFGDKIGSRLFGKGSRSFRKQLRALMLKCAVDICVDLIAKTRGTTGNAAFSWHVTLTKNSADQIHGKYYKNPKGYLKALAQASAGSSMYHSATAEATARERANQSNPDLQPLSKNGYTIYISNYAFVAPFGTEIKRLKFQGYYTRFMVDNNFGKYNSGVTLNSQSMDEYVQRKFRDSFNAGLKRIK